MHTVWIIMIWIFATTAASPDHRRDSLPDWRVQCSVFHVCRWWWQWWWCMRTSQKGNKLITNQRAALECDVSLIPISSYQFQVIRATSRHLWGHRANMITWFVFHLSHSVWKRARPLSVCFLLRYSLPHWRPSCKELSMTTSCCQMRQLHPKTPDQSVAYINYSTNSAAW